MKSRQLNDQITLSPYFSSLCPLWLNHPRNRLSLAASQADTTSLLPPRRRCARNDILCRSRDASSMVSVRCANAKAQARATFRLHPCAPLNKRAIPRSIFARAPDKSSLVLMETNLPACRSVARFQRLALPAPLPGDRRGRCLRKQEYKVAARSTP